ncbi:MAG: hypothetical protein P3W93_003725 [Thermus sp.]|nr:hypothetical protein [Thermus sp.]
MHELDQIEEELKALEEVIAKMVYPLHVKRKYKRCGKKGCRCQRGQPHGPYLYGYRPDEAVKEKRKEKGWKGSTRKEIYLGKDWIPPEGYVEPRVFQEALRRYNWLRKRREAIRDAVEGKG